MTVEQKELKSYYKLVQQINQLIKIAEILSSSNKDYQKKLAELRKNEQLIEKELQEKLGELEAENKKLKKENKILKEKEKTIKTKIDRLAVKLDEIQI